MVSSFSVLSGPTRDQALYKTVGLHLALPLSLDKMHSPVCDRRSSVPRTMLEQDPLGYLTVDNGLSHKRC